MSKCEVFSGSYFSVFGLITGKHRPEKTPYLDTLHAVNCASSFQWVAIFSVELSDYFQSLKRSFVKPIIAGNYMLKVNNRDTRTRFEICSKLTIKIPERRHWRRSGIFMVNFEHISHLGLVFLFLTLSR